MATNDRPVSELSAYRQMLPKFQVGQLVLVGPNTRSTMEKHHKEAPYPSIIREVVVRFWTVIQPFYTVSPLDSRGLQMVPEDQLSTD